MNRTEIFCRGILLPRRFQVPPKADPAVVAGVNRSFVYSRTYGVISVYTYKPERLFDNFVIIRGNIGFYLRNYYCHKFSLSVVFKSCNYGCPRRKVAVRTYAPYIAVGRYAECYRQFAVALAVLNVETVQYVYLSYNINTAQLLH